MAVPEPEPDISVIIAAYNAAGTLPTQLLALTRQDFTGQFEVLVCDNGSTDATREVARSWVDRLPLLRVVDASDMAGGGFAKNVGVINAGAPLVAFCDADDYVVPGWLTAIHHGLESHEIVTGPLGDVPHDFDQVDPVRVIDSTEFTTDFVRSPGGPVAAGCNSGFARSVLSQGHAFMDDPITSLRALRQGHQITWCPEAKVLYRSRPPDGPQLGRAISSGTWRAAADREFGGGVLYGRDREMHMTRSAVWLALQLPGATVKGQLKSLRWDIGFALGVFIERYLPGYWWGRVNARRRAGKTDAQTIITDSLTLDR